MQLFQSSREPLQRDGGFKPSPVIVGVAGVHGREVENCLGNGGRHVTEQGYLNLPDRHINGLDISVEKKSGVQMFALVT